MTDAELTALLRDTESDLVERKASLADRDRICETICAFANDLADRRRPGVLFIGAHDDGSCAHLPVADQLLTTIADMRSDGRILPLPQMSVEKRVLDGCEMAVVVVQPSDAPPVRFKGRTWVRVGPRRAIATLDEERRLSEKRRARDLPWDLRPFVSATVKELSLGLFEEYLRAAIPDETLVANGRSIAEKMTALRFLDTDGHPTACGLMTLATDVLRYIPGAYVQFLRIDGNKLTDPIKDAAEISGPLPRLVPRLDDKLAAHINMAVIIESGGPSDIRVPDYPIEALKQLTRNAIMHRNYETSNAPVRVTWFNDRIEIRNSGGPYGEVTVANFGQPGVVGYRNPHIAEVMRNLGFVQRFGVGIQLARDLLRQNSNPPLEFEVSDATVAAIVRRRL